MRKWTISEIKQANAEAGHVFFDKSHTKHSRTFPYVYQGAGGVAFVTCDADEFMARFRAWKFIPETGAIRLIGAAHYKPDTAKQAAKDYAKGGE